MFLNFSFGDFKSLPEILSEDKITNLFIDFYNGNSDSRDKIIYHNLRLICFEIKKKFSTVKYDKEDLFSIGTIGLMKAVDTFDINKGIKFSSYASRCIDNEILMFLRKIKKDKNLVSIDTTISFDNEGNELKIIDTLFDTDDKYENYDNKELYSNIDRVIDTLPDKEKDIIKLFFGFYDGKKHNQYEIAKKLNISQSYTSRLLKRLVKKVGILLSQNELIELPNINKKTVVKPIFIKKLRTIYDYFSNYSKDEVDEIISRLDNDDKIFLNLRYGNNLDNPSKSLLDLKQTKRFYRYLIPKMKKMFLNLYQNEVTDNTSINNIVLTTFKLNNLEYLSSFSSKEIVVIMLKFGYIDGKEYSNGIISNYLEIDELEIIDICKKYLLLLKDIINDNNNYVLRK